MSREVFCFFFFYFLMDDRRACSRGDGDVTVKKKIDEEVREV